MKGKIASTIIQLTIGPSKNFSSHIETPCVSSYLAQSSYLVRNRDFAMVHQSFDLRKRLWEKMTNIW